MKNTVTCVLALVVLIAFALPAAATDACKGIKIKEDKFGGGKVVDVNVLLMNLFVDVGMDIKLEGDRAEILLQFRDGGAFDVDIPAGVEIPFLFADDEVVPFPLGRPASAQTHATSSSVYTIVTYPLALDADRLHKLRRYTLEAVRIPGPEGLEDRDVPKASGKKLKSVADCLFTLLDDE